MAGLPAAKTFYAVHMGLIHGTAQLSNPSRPEPQEWRCVSYMGLLLRPQHPGEPG